MTAWRTVFWVYLLAAAWTVGGCKESAGFLGLDGPCLVQRLRSEDPTERMQAIVEAGVERDANAVPFLVDRLTDSEDHLRLGAILALERITGTRRGYRHFDEEWKRYEAVRRWRRWLDHRAATQPATQPAEGPATQPAEGRP